MRKNMTLKKTMAILLAAGVFITSIPVESISAEPLESVESYNAGVEIYEEYPSYEEAASFEEVTSEEPIYEDPTYETTTYEEPTSVEPTYAEPVYVEPTYVEPTYVEPTYAEPTYVEPAYVEPTYVEPTYVEPTYQEQTYVEPTYETTASVESVYYEEPTTAQPTSTFFFYEDDLLYVAATLYDWDALPEDTRLIVKQISPEDPELFKDPEYLRWETEDQKKDRLLYEWTDRMLTESLEDQELYAVDSLIYDLYFEQNGERLMPEGPFRVYFAYKKDKVLNEDADKDNVRFIYLDDNEITRKVDAIDTRADLKVNEKGSVVTADFYIGRYRHTPLVISMLETKEEHEQRLKEEAEAAAALEAETEEETAPESETPIEEMTEAETEPEIEPETTVEEMTEVETEPETEEETETTVEDETQEDVSDEDDREGDPVRTYYANWSGDVSATIILSNPAQVPDTAEVEVTAVTPDTVGADYDAYMEALNNSSDTTEYTAENTLLYDIRFVDTILDENGEEQRIEYEPAEGSVRVMLRFKQNQLSNEINAESNENVEVNHLVVDAEAETAEISAADISVELVEANVKLEGTDTVSFQTESFSVYAFVCTTLRQTLTASDGNEYLVTVTYDYASGIPSDAELYVSEIKEGEAGYEEYVAQSVAALGERPENLVFARPFDITLKNPRTGEEYQPNGNVQVSIELLKDELNNYASVDVVHIPDGGGEDAQVMETTVHGESVEFETDGFSVYVLIGSDGRIVTPQSTYTFYVPNPDIPGEYKELAFTDSQGHTIYKQTITSGEELIVPQLTSTDTEVFAGWYLGDRTGGPLTLADAPYDFDNITITENRAIDLYAVYQNYAVVVFHDQYDSESKTFPVAYTRRAELVTTGEGEAANISAMVKISDLSTTYTSTGGANMSFFGWSETPITTPGAAKDDEGSDVVAITTDAEGRITVTGEKHLYPIYQEVHRLTYYAAQTGLSAAYVPPAQFFAGDPVSYDNNGTKVYSLPVTSRDGYTFLGWWTGTLTTNDNVETVNYGAQVTGSDGNLVASADDGGVYISEGKLYLRSDAVLYAKWEASYSIVYWKQVTTENPDTAEKHYEYAETVTRTAQIGTTVSVADEDRADDRYDGYQYSSCDPVSASIGNTKELTVLNVYYDLSAEYEASGQTHTLTFADSVIGEGAANMPSPVEKLAYQTALEAYIPSNPTSGRTSDSGKAIYSFDAWYMDQACTIKANFDTMKMPDHDLTVYAGWTAIKFRVDIDPNYGALYPEENDPSGTGATYFNNTYDAEPIGEYTHVTRDYVESSSGTWYYVNHDRAYGGDRHTYYTEDPALATEDTTFEKAPGVYTYVGWYEVYLDADGNEIGEASEPYDFSQHTDHNTKLRLHWKKAGTYYLAYDAGNGTLEDGTTKSVILPSGYADYADVVLTQSAIAPTGYTFIGWQVRGSDSSVIYTPGKSFTLHADDAKRVSGKDVVYLDAVYARVGTASITYDVNGGTVASAESVDFGKVPGSSADEWNSATGTVDTTAGTATVSGLANNSKFKLSNGAGFTAPAGSGAAFLGWSDKAVCDDSATFYAKDSNVIYGISESTTLYAVWGAQVTYHLNSTYAEWGDIAWDSTVYTRTGDIYSQTANLGTVVSEPVNVPVYTGTDERLFRYWATRAATEDETNPYTYTEYNFSQPITGALDLYAYWGEENTITVHAVDASSATLVEKNSEDGWTISNVAVSATETVLNGESHVTKIPDNYEFAFVAVASDLDSVSESNAVTAIKYENKQVKVKYVGETSFRVLGEGKGLYFVYYQGKALNIGYKSMDTNGVLENVVTTGAPGTTGETLLGEYSMSSQLTAPLSLVEGFTNYAFAIGITDPGEGTQMNASNLSLITNAVGAGAPVPTLRVRNTWRGFEYTTETGDNAVWTSCGYDPQLYVIYYTQQATVVMFNEKTVGTSTVMDTAFTFNLLVTETTTTTVSVQKQTKDGDNWIDAGEPTETTTVGETTIVFDTTVEGNQPYILKTGEANSSILFYSKTSSKEEGSDDGTETRQITTTTTVTEQTAQITQTADDAFTTAIDVDGTAYTESSNVYTYTATSSSGTVNVTFTNTHKSLPVEVHVAMVENDGTNGGIIQRDNTFRNKTEMTYQFDLAFDTSETLLTKLSSAAVFTGNVNTYAFGAIMSGIGSEGSAVTVESMGVTSIAYEKIEDEGGVYGLVLKDSDGTTIGELGSNQIYYLYYPMPKIRYVKEAADGTLTDITGCLVDPTTGNIEASDSVTYSHKLLTMNGKNVAQNQSFEISLSGFTISQSGNNFRMPPVLDDGLYERYLRYVKLGAGSGGATNTSTLNVSTGLTMQLKVQNNTLQYSFDGSTWKDLPLSGTPTIYAIYEERGYDFQISKTVDTSESGENAIFSNASFTVTISSTAITKDRYDAEGAESATVVATPASGKTPGTIVLTVADGTKVRIKGLGQGEYTITESGNENYTLTARTGSIVGGSTSSTAVTKNTTVTFSLDAEKKVDLINSPKAICRIGDRYFYTLRSMVEYVDSDIATKTATAEMLTDYLMPVADTVEIPNGCNITLTTPESGGHVAVITRAEELADVPLFTNNGTLTITNVTLEGNSIEATAPMIQSAGDLAIDLGATIRNVAGGGAISATAGDITVSGTIQNCSAAKGGAIYHAGNGTITLSGAGVIQNNIATSGNGGAIYLVGGTINVFGTSKITGNKAESGNGGAIYVVNAVIQVDQGGSITDNIAQEGGAIYAETGTISVSRTIDNASPAITGNTATTGNGGAIRVGVGSVTVSGGSVSNNKADNGQGGAIYVNTASVTVSGDAAVETNTAREGGAVYAVSGAVTVSGGTVDSNTATAGNGGAVYATSGNVTVSGGSLSGNKAEAGSGGAIHVTSGNVTVSGGSLSENTAKTDGGAINAGSGTVALSVPGSGTTPTIKGNTATDGNGGVICANTGVVRITGITLTGNNAGASGGAVYAASGAVTLTNSIFGGNEDNDGNTAKSDGGAVYAGSGNVTVSGGSMQNNKSTDGNGGALYVGSGAATVSGYKENNNTTFTQFTNNSAASGKGGAVYLDTGSLTLTTVTATGNSAINGAAIFTNTGRANFSAGSYTSNVASEGGAVGVGNTEARLYFTGNVQVRDNKLGTADDAPKSNVYLNQDDDAVINIGMLDTDADIGIYVPDAFVPTRSVPGARFAVYTSNLNAAKITNDRFPALTVQSDTAAKKFFWGNSIKVEVRYLASYSGVFPPAAGTTKYTNNDYYPEFNDGAISELAAELITKNSINPGSTTAVYGGAFQEGASDFADYVTRLTWSTTESKWRLTKRDGRTVDLDGKKIIIYYAEPAYISIENNTDMTLTITDMKVNDINVINSDTVAGYGMVFAKNGAIRTALLPVAASDLVLTAGQSINLLIPGGRNLPYTLDGSFNTTTAGNVRLRRTNVTPEESLTYAADGTFEKIDGTTLNGNGTYSIIFGDDKVICKVVDADGVEHPYSKISDAITAIKSGTITLATAKTATIEMVTDYLLPASDVVEIPKGYNITITTAAKDGVTYPYIGEGNRATISRNSENTGSMITTQDGDENSSLILINLVFDGKSVRGNSDGGAISTKIFKVQVENVDFYNIYASRGGALFIDTDSTTAARSKDYSILTVKDCKFIGCNSTKLSGTRLGGGAIHAYVSTLNMSNCYFENCDGGDQAGAVFHRVESDYNSWSNITGCTFLNCTANAAGGLELDSKYITVTDCIFEHCISKNRNGGGFNIYSTNAASPNVSTDCWAKVSGCTFYDCHADNGGQDNYGGGFRSNVVETTVENSTFRNCSAIYGGGIGISNTNATTALIRGCIIENCNSTRSNGRGGHGGGIYCSAISLTIEDFITDEGQPVSSSITNCTAVLNGGGIYHSRDASTTALTITNATIKGNVANNTGNDSGGGGVFATNIRKVKIDGSEITRNTSAKFGGGLYTNAQTSLVITNSSISENITAGTGGGVYYSGAGTDGLTILNSDIESNTSGGSGGGVYTNVKIVEVKDSSISNNRVETTGTGVVNGGGIQQNNTDVGSKLMIIRSKINGNSTNKGYGGGIYSNSREMSVVESEVSDNTASNNGGGICYENKNSIGLNIEGTTLDSNISGNHGGGIYTTVKNVGIKTHTEGEGENAVTTPTIISSCTAAASGGGIYQSQNIEGSTLTITGAEIRSCTSNDTNTGWDHGGGGVFAYVRTVDVTDSEISDNSAKGKGGGIVMGPESSNYMLTIDDSKIIGNTSENQGGGIATRSQLTLRNGTEITGNRLTTNTAGDCAGVYLNNNRTLFIGPADAPAGFTDTIIVRGNTTANGTLSDLRLWESGGQNVGKVENNTEYVSAYIYCNLEGEIRVVNAAKVGTWFGRSAIVNPDGFSDNDPVFKADSSTLHGIIDRTDDGGTKIIWAGPPIAKITDGEGNLLYLKGGDKGSDPAIFDRLNAGNNGNFGTTSAFGILNGTDTPPLYTEDGGLYEGDTYCIKMLVESFTSEAYLVANYHADRTIIFTTAGKEDAQYPFEGRTGGRATVIRGSGTGNNHFLNANVNMVIESLVLDGGSENGIAANGSTRILWINNSNVTVTLGENAVLQNGKVSGSNSHGGGVYVNNGSFEIRGGTIRNCTAQNGGGVYKTGKQTLTLEAGSIYQCTAIGNGGGVYLNDGSFNMSGGTISGGSAAQGGGVYVTNSAARPFNMSGGSIINNNATAAGGGIAVQGENARIYFSGKVNVSGNTCDASVAPGNACNVELNQDRPTTSGKTNDGIINTNNGGLYPGSYIGVYVPDGTNLYDKHGVERKPFGSFSTGDNTTTFYSFVNDRNGLKGGIIEQTDPNYVKNKNCIYWIQIFSLRVSKEIEAGSSTTADPDESFLFKVNVRGKASASGQLDAKDIDSTRGEYGEMEFRSNGSDTTTAVFALKDGESVTGVNLSEGLMYEVIEYLTLDQARQYAAMPMNGYNSATETLRYQGVDYTVIRVNIYTSTIGENKSRTDIDPYTSAVTFTNLMPVCKITDSGGRLLYQKYSWNGSDFYAPAVYTELTGDNGAFMALAAPLYTSNGSNPISYSVSNGVQIQMLIGEYTLYEPVAANTSKVTLTTASASDALFPKQDAGTTSTIRRAFAEGSMFEVSGDLTLATIILDGVKGSYTAEANGGIANVESEGKLTIQNGATLQNSSTAEGYNGGAVFVADGGTVTMTGGTINRNESVGDGAGIYLAEGSTLNLSGNPSFGGTGRDVSGNITTTNGNFKAGELVAATNGGKAYSKARQDIFIAEDQDDPASVVLTGNLNVTAGSIWIWAETENHYAMMKPFATIASGTVNGATYAAFRNAQPDSVTNCGEDNYLSGSSGENVLFVYWAGGFDVSFKKVDGLGNAMPGATFTLYTDSACTETLKQGGEDAAAISADGTATYQDRTGETLDAGIVLFEQIPAGVYYMKETDVPDGYVNALTKDDNGEPVGNVYMVLVGDAALQRAGDGVLVDITQEQITAQTGTGDDKKDAAIFLIDPTTDRAVAAPDIAKYGIMNTSTSECKAILRKVNSTNASLEGAEFEILRFDKTLVSSTDAKGKTVTTFTSDASGVYFIDMLPFGTYYLHEKGYPEGVQENGTEGWWYTLTVDEDGITCSEQSAEEPGTTETP